MIPLSEYATVHKDAPLFEAVLALEKTHEKHNHDGYRHRTLFVLDDGGDVIGKVTRLDILGALEPQYEHMLNRKGMTGYGFSRSFMKSLLEQFQLWDGPMADICKSAVKVPVYRFMYTPDEGESVDKDATLDEAIHQMVMGRYQSLQVTQSGRITGVLRMADVFDTVFHVMKKSLKV